MLVSREKRFRWNQFRTYIEPKGQCVCPLCIWISTGFTGTQTLLLYDCYIHTPFGKTKQTSCWWITTNSLNWRLSSNGRCRPKRGVVISVNGPRCPWRPAGHESRRDQRWVSRTTAQSGHPVSVSVYCILLYRVGQCLLYPIVPITLFSHHLSSGRLLMPESVRLPTNTRRFNVNCLYVCTVRLVVRPKEPMTLFTYYSFTMPWCAL